MTLRDERSIQQPRFVEVRDYIVDPETGCWNWQRVIDRAGYARYGATCWLVHREMYRRYRGAFPDHYDVHHTCENTACVNPAHLEALEPSVHRRRHKQENSSLTAEQVRDIRMRAWRGEKLVDLALAFGVGRHAIQKIVLGINWQDAGGPIRETVPRYCSNCGERVPETKRRSAQHCSVKCRQQVSNRKLSKKRSAARKAAREAMAA